MPLHLFPAPVSAGGCVWTRVRLGRDSAAKESVLSHVYVAVTRLWVLLVFSLHSVAMNTERDRENNCSTRDARGLTLSDLPGILLTAAGFKCLPAEGCTFPCCKGSERHCLSSGSSFSHMNSIPLPEDLREHETEAQD